MFPAAVRAIVFDVVGTLVEPHPAVADAYHRAAGRHGVACDVAEIGRRFRSAWTRQEAIDAAATPAFATDQDRERRRWREIVAEVFAGAPESDAIFIDLWESFARPAAWRPLPAGVHLARAARDAGLTVALASNFDGRLFPLARAIEPLSWAEHVFVSAEIGWRKPAAEFFRVVEGRLGLTAPEVLIVGDDPELDVAAGRRAGWHAWDVATASATSRGRA